MLSSTLELFDFRLHARFLSFDWSIFELFFYVIWMFSFSTYDFLFGFLFISSISLIHKSFKGVLSQYNVQSELTRNN